jgi:endonuclease YncB( thermonuclease family)
MPLVAYPLTRYAGKNKYKVVGMQWKTWLVTAVGGLIVGAHYLQLNAAEPKTKVEVLYCHDGDTCRVKINSALWVNVRLAGIDAPEVKGRGKSGQPMAQEARDFISAKLKGKVVDMRQTDLDGYNRPVVEFFMDDKLLNVEVLKKGLAEAYRGKTKRLDKVMYLSAEDEAKQAKLGIWSSADYQSPAVYRKR